MTVQSRYSGLQEAIVVGRSLKGEAIWAPATSGNRYYVDSGHTSASDGQTGLDAGKPMATIDAAHNRCAANNGDQVIVLPGHAETIAAGGITMDTAGVSIYGMGIGDARPTITFNATTSDIDITAKDTVFCNCKCSSSINSLVAFFDVGVGNVTIEHNHMQTASTLEAICFIDLATTFDNFWIQGNYFDQPTDPEGTDAAVNTGAIYLVDSQNIFIEDNVFIGQFETAIVHNKTTKCLNLYFNRNIVDIQLATCECVLLVDTSTGMADFNIVQNQAAATVLIGAVWGTPGSLFFVGVNNSVSNDGAAGGELAAPGALVTS